MHSPKLCDSLPPIMEKNTMIGEMPIEDGTNLEYNHSSIFCEIHAGFFG